MRARRTAGLVSSGILALCCSAGQAGKNNDSHVTQPGPDAGAGASAGASASAAGSTSIVPVMLNPDASMPISMEKPDHPEPTCTSACTDLPADPVIDIKGPTVPPANAATLFGAADNMGSTGPCVLEPQLAQASDPGSLFPANWLRPRFRFQPLAGENLWEVRVHADSEAHDLVIYTTATSVAMPRDAWLGLANNVLLKPITVTIRGVNSAAPGKPSGTRGTFQVAPVFAGGAMVYWASTTSAVTPDSSKLVGFRVGDEGAIDALKIPQVSRQIINQTASTLRTPGEPGAPGDPGAIRTPRGAVQCIGCHTSTPDGKSVGFTDLWPWNGVIASVEAATVGQQPSYVSAGAATLINQPWLGMLTFSKGQWSDGKHLVVTGYTSRTSTVGFSMPSDGSTSTLAWFNLDTPTAIPWTDAMPGPTNAAVASSEKMAWGRITLGGETASAISPAFSHDGKSVFYTSATKEQDGRIGDNNSDVNIHLVPFNDGAGGTVSPLAGAAEPGFAEYYPNLSVDDRFVAFNKMKLDALPIYYRAEGEINVIPAAGGTAKRLAANDPPACGGQKSPGVLNSWPKWSPGTTSINGKNYYWLIFSSARAYPGQFKLPGGGGGNGEHDSSQLYMAAVVEDATTHELQTFDGVYLWNQDPATTNLTPAWDDFEIPEVPQPPK